MTWKRTFIMHWQSRKMADLVQTKLCTSALWVDIVIYLKQYPNSFSDLGEVGVQILASQCVTVATVLKTLGPW